MRVQAALRAANSHNFWFSFLGALHGGVLAPNLQLGSDLTSCQALIANNGLAAEGVKPHGMGFVLSADERQHFINTDPQLDQFIKPYKNGRDIVQNDRIAFIIDLAGMTESEVAQRAPALYQRVYDTVRPERLTNKEPYRRENWWLFGRKNTDLRSAISELARYLVTVKTAKHRIFVFLNGGALPDSKLIAVASDDAFVLGVLSSAVHCAWTLKIGAHLGVGNDPTYVVGSSFNKFPFPALEESPLKQRIRELGERLDAHRKRQQELHPDLTLTGLYNVLEKLRAGDTLNAKEKTLHDQGLVTLLRQIHDELDAAVLEAYGWADLHPLTPEREPELLTRLVALNHARAAEEKTGLIRWLRPDYQNPGATAAPQPIQAHLAVTETAPKTENSKPETLAWPERLPDQVTLLRQFLATDPTASAETLSAHFGRKSPKRTEQITGILETLRGLGHV